MTWDDPAVQAAVRRRAAPTLGLMDVALRPGMMGGSDCG